MLNGENNGVETIEMNEALATASEEQELQDELTASSEQVSEEQEPEAQAVSDEVAEEPAPAVARTATKEKAHEVFLAALKAHASAIGLSAKEQVGFFQFFNQTTGHKLYVAKQSKDVTRIDTTLPLQDMGFEDAYPLEKPNGRVACHVKPTIEAVSSALNILATHSEKIRAPKREVKAEASQTNADKK